MVIFYLKFFLKITNYVQNNYNTNFSISIITNFQIKIKY